MTIPSQGSGLAGALVIDGISARTASSSSTQTFTLVNSPNSNGVTIINGDIKDNATGPVA